MELKQILEAILFASQKPLSPRDLRDVLADAAQKSEDPAAKPFKRTKEADVLAALAQLEQEHVVAGRSFRLVCVAGSWQFVSLADYGPWLRALAGEKARPPRLSQPALETLAIVAYRQPITRAEIEQIRGVSVDGVMQTLLERGLIENAGRAEVIGRPMTYGTTSAFLEYFGLGSLDGLPAADELRRIPVEKPAALLTADPGLATAPPEALAEAERVSAEVEGGGIVTAPPEALAHPEPPPADAEASQVSTPPESDEPSPPRDA